jgi:nucleotide-binding universal stress UspA family protein
MPRDALARGPIVVGVDGAPHSATALAWAAKEAFVRRRRLRVVHAYLGEQPSAADTPAAGPVGEAGPPSLNSSAREVLASAVADVRADFPDLDVDGALVSGWPVPVLLEESERAALLVVGSRALGPVRDVVEGAVSRVVVQQASCPVVVVRERASGSLAHLRIVVGVDRESSADALEFAFDEARCWGAGLTVVHTWTAVPAVPGALAGRHWSVDREQLADGERHWLESALEEWRERYPDVEVVRSVVEGEPGPQLVRLSQNARMLVVGARGRGPVAALVLGSVSMDAVHHAHCPVAVVPRRRTDTAADAVDPTEVRLSSGQPKI